MTIMIDHASRSYYLQVASGPGITVRTHVAPSPGERLAQNRQRMRAGAREVLSVLKRGGYLTFAQIKRQLPEISTSTLQVRLSNLTSREDIERYGSKGAYRYALPEGSTFRST